MSMIIVIESVIDTGQKRSFFSFSPTKSTSAKVNRSPPANIETNQRTVQNIRPSVRRTRRKKSAAPRIKSAKSIVLVHPKDQTIAIVEILICNSMIVVHVLVVALLP
jgi:hypothetical protein